MLSSRYFLGFLLFAALISMISASDAETQTVHHPDVTSQSGKGKKGDPPRPRPKPGPRDGGDDD